MAAFLKKHHRKVSYVSLSLLCIGDGGSLVYLLFIYIFTVKVGLFRICRVAAVTCSVALHSTVLHRACSQ